MIHVRYTRSPGHWLAGPLAEIYKHSKEEGNHRYLRFSNEGRLI